ncbi:dihydroxyacetone kinase subunit L [Loigolactobacillus coryniformis]|uniref:dihydroxyacetone kinase subunit DhaL n=1 Tax=Loigolactobacillus coryniformis TaxID=1610 RepID=UPI00233FC467|nr:dihydroxyacetone kinase subunit DhaL [Loigolactobacillus coryniformis]MDC4186258.1 dihydroxyacetone kinase subunit L [Loigolactobacillus coryniformis]
MTLTLEDTLKWLHGFDATVTDQKAYLSELDTPIGDGDHGNNLARGAAAIEDALSKQAPADLTAALKTIAMALVSKVGGASGALYGTAFLEMAKASRETQDVAELLAAGLAGIQKRGGATTGEKTMVDVWAPVVAAAKAGNLTEQVITDAVQATEPMKATKGRASYVGDNSIGHLDPGSVSSGYLFSELLKAGVTA